MVGCGSYTLLKAHSFHMRDDSLPSAAPSFVCAAVLDKLTRLSKVVKTKLHRQLRQIHLNNMW